MKKNRSGKLLLDRSTIRQLTARQARNVAGGRALNAELAPASGAPASGAPASGAPASGAPASGAPY